MPQISLLSPLEGWLCPLADVPDDAFAQGVLGAGFAIDPLGAVLHAPAAGQVVAVHAAGHAITLRLAPGLDVLMHFGLETVRLGGVGFAPQVAVGAQVAAGDALLRVDMAAVAPKVKSLITPVIVVEAGGYALQLTAQPGPVRVGDALGLLVAADAPVAAAVAEFDPTARRELRVPLAHGLHARPSARLAQCAAGFAAQVRVEKAGTRANLASPSAMLRLAVAHGDRITLLASGADADAALDALAHMIASGMGEGAPLPVEGDTPPPAAPAQDSARAPVAPTAITALPQAGDVLVGVTAAAGLAVGQAWRMEVPEPPIAEHSLGHAAEQARLDGALAGVIARLDAQAGKGAPAQQAILAAHRAMLADAELLEGVSAVIAKGASAGVAWRQILQAEAKALRALPDPRFAERANDVLDLERQVQWELAGGQPPAPVPPVGAIVVADDLMPSQVAELDATRVVGLATARGGPTSHVAILAAARGIPAVVALGASVLALPQACALVLDATHGRLEVEPSPQRLEQALEQRAKAATARAAAAATAHEIAHTACGARIEVFANLGKLADVAPALAHGAEGCGLLRSEFLFLDRASAPSEDEQTADYAAIAQGMEGRPLIIRLLDIGGDKPAPYLPIGPEENPALGLRGIRVGLARPEVLATQLRAILRAGAQGWPIKIMVPMIARLEELQAVHAAMLQQAADLGVPPLPLGVMVETPAAAVMADVLASQADFLSVGTNDLTQYALAMDRGNPAVAGGIDGLDPSVLRLIAQTCRGADAHGKWVGVCGGLASDLAAVPLLLGLGVSELSAAPAMVPQVKALVRGVTLAQCRGLAASALQAGGAGQVRAGSAVFLGELGL